MAMWTRGGPKHQTSQLMELNAKWTSSKPDAEGVMRCRQGNLLVLGWGIGEGWKKLGTSPQRNKSPTPLIVLVRTTSGDGTNSSDCKSQICYYCCDSTPVPKKEREILAREIILSRSSCLCSSRPINWKFLASSEPMSLIMVHSIK